MNAPTLPTSLRTRASRMLAAFRRRALLAAPLAVALSLASLATPAHAMPRIEGQWCEGSTLYVWYWDMQRDTFYVLVVSGGCTPTTSGGWGEGPWDWSNDHCRVIIKSSWSDNNCSRLKSEDLESTFDGTALEPPLKFYSEGTWFIQPPPTLKTFPDLGATPPIAMDVDEAKKFKYAWVEWARAYSLDKMMDSDPLPHQRNYDMFDAMTSFVVVTMTADGK